MELQFLIYHVEGQRILLVNGHKYPVESFDEALELMEKFMAVASK
jgi:hypothetical protein